MHLPPDHLPPDERGSAPPEGAPDGPQALRLLREAQQQTAQVHSEHQRMMAESHQAFLNSTQAALAGLARLALEPGAPEGEAARDVQEGDPSRADAEEADPVGPYAGFAIGTDIAPPPSRTSEEAAADLPGTTVTSATVADTTEPAAAAHEAAAPEPDAPEPHAPENTAPAGGQAAAHSAEHLAEVLRTVVADLTGYPEDILTPDMALEADLGIDSIKRVQILAALRQQVPRLADVEVADVAALHTLGDVTERLAEAEAATGRKSSLQDRAGGPAPPRLVRLAPVAVPSGPPRLSVPGLNTSVLITDDGAGVAPALAAELTAHGIRARVTSEPPTDGTAREAGCVVLLDALRAYASPCDASGALHRDLMRSLRALAPSSPDRSTGRETSVVIVHDSGGDFGECGRQGEQAWLNGGAALARTAAREWPSAVVRAIDCERGHRPPEAVGRALAAELLTGGADPDVALSADGERRVLAYEEAPPSSAAPDRFGADSFLVVTGGGRGITAECLSTLAGRVRGVHLLLLGRTPLPDESPEETGPDGLAALTRTLMDRDRASGRVRPPAQVRAEAAQHLAAHEVRATLRRLEEAGATVRYAAVDTRDPVAVRSCLDKVRADWGPVTGLVHAAGVIADKPLTDKTDDQFDTVFTTKVDGLRHLLDATAEDPLDTVCLFSSVSAAVGNAGQADYAAANAVQDHMAAVLARQRPDARVVSLAWGAWRGGMVTPELQEHFDEAGTALIAPEAGAAAFADEVLSARGPTRIVLVPDADQIARWGATGPRARRPAPRGAVLVNGEQHPELADHAIAGRVILPVATAVELLARAVPGQRDVGRPFALHDVRVRGTLVLEDYPDTQWLTLHAAHTPGPDGWSLELRGAGDCPRFTAVAPLEAPGTPQDPAKGAPRPAPCPPLRYGDKAHFHGPLFQVVDEVVGCDTAGSLTVLHGLAEMGWPRERLWRTDPALVDGAMQSAVLWAEQAVGRATLPMAVSRCVVHRPGPAGPGPVTCRVTGRSADELEAVCDAVLTDEDGAVRATLHGIRLVVRPD
ncbi:SDR family NAD(P)-dependent oxidoreductase [Streptomyces sp. NPDC058812]|uniref:SDR family NAD(P)-dependent oxidoreductase n=1 Tax=unclassified Streptomyces TaxID=2593676 RepID=UPI0036D1722B